MSTLRGFSPVENVNARVLILGSMPGEASLLAGEYYAHPRNYFWRIMSGLISLDAEAPYTDRVEALEASGFALWDVLDSCKRKGSLDANIEKSSLITNNFELFFAQHLNIVHVFFNGSAAEHIYRKNVLPALNLPHIEYQRLPSTSPANASISFERKLEAWKALLL